MWVGTHAFCTEKLLCWLYRSQTEVHILEQCKWKKQFLATECTEYHTQLNKSTSNHALPHWTGARSVQVFESVRVSTANKQHSGRSVSVHRHVIKLHSAWWRQMLEYENKKWAYKDIIVYSAPNFAAGLKTEQDCHQVHTTSIVRYNQIQNKTCCINLRRPEGDMSDHMIINGEIWSKVYELNWTVS